MMTGDLIALVAAVLAFVGAWVGGRSAIGYQAKLEKRALAAGFRAEIRCYLEIVERRHHEEAALALIEALENGTVVKRSALVDREESADLVFPFFRAHLSTMGALGPDLTERIATFYSLVMSVRTDIIAWERGRFAEVGPIQLAELLRADHALWREAVGLGRGLEADLRRCAESPKPRPALKTAVLLVLVAIICWGAFRLADVERQRYAMQTGLCGGAPPAGLPAAACLVSAQPRTSWWWNLFQGISG